MIRPHNLSPHIRDVAIRYQKAGEKFDVFPSKFLISGQLYYYIAYSPAKEQLVICDDGTVLPLEQIKRVAMIANGYNAAIESITKFGGPWLQSSESLKNKFKKLQRILEELHKLIKDQAPQEVLSALDAYMRIPPVMIENQEKIDECVRKGAELGMMTNEREVATEEDYHKMRSYQVGLAHGAYFQNDIQLKTADDRQVVMDYLSSHKSLRNWKIWFIYLLLKPYEYDLISEKNYPKEAKEMKELAELFEDVPLEENPVAIKHLDYLRNPRS